MVLLQEAECLKEPCSQEEARSREVSAVNKEESKTLFVGHDLGRVSQVSIPSEEEGARQDDVEAAYGLDSIENGKIAQVRVIQILGLLSLAHLVWLHVHLVNVPDGRDGDKVASPWQLLLHDYRFILSRIFEFIQLVKHIFIEFRIITNR